MFNLSFLPWVSLVAGFAGSLHCVGMCGGLVTSTCQKTKDVGIYQFGRLLGYLCLGFFAGALGKIFTIQEANPKMTLIPGLLLGGLFLYWGIQNFRGRKGNLRLPKFLNQLYTKLWVRFVYNNKNSTKSFFTGLISLFLPCGLLYSVVLGVAAFEHSIHALLTMFFFWLGTLPAMLLAPSIIQNILRPIKLKMPQTYAISLILIGLLTISYRVVRFQNIYAGDRNPSATHHCH
jgi:sulfite exporter TauE/SafE